MLQKNVKYHIDKKENPNGCNCRFCKIYHKYKWAVIIECGCCCHDSSELSGHDSLCCEFPNGKKKDNPYKKLASAKYYKAILSKIIKQSEEQIKKELNKGWVQIVHTLPIKTNDNTKKRTDNN